MISKNQEFVFVHLGKTGGSSIIDSLKKHGFHKFEVIHVQKVKYNPNKKYVLLLRDPIARFISAFNWRYFLLIDDKQKKSWDKNTKPASKNELQLLLKYKTPNALAEDIVNFNYNKDYIHHINEGYEFYFNDFILNFDKKSILGIMKTESLQEDFSCLFGISAKLSNEKQNSSYCKSLSELGRQNLIAFLKKDYIIFKQLENQL